jgi:hypothetical protein
VVLVIVSAFLRTRQLSGELWFNEAIATGIASHSLSALPGVLRNGGSSPLYYLLLHFWISGLGPGESATHALSVLFGLLTIPAAMWAAWSLFGRRAGMYAAALFAFSAYLTRYAQETQPYELLVLLGVLATAGFLHGFVYRRRGFLVLFTLSLALMLYTQASAILFWVGTAVALVPVWLAASTSSSTSTSSSSPNSNSASAAAPASAAEPTSASDERRGILRDAGMTFGGALILYLPWLPTTIYQLSHATSPWHYAPLLGATVPSDLLGGERVDVVLLVAALVGLAPLLQRANRRTPAWTAMWALIAIPITGLLLARASSLVTPGWVARYFGTLLAPMLLFAAFSSARARIIGLAAIVLSVAFVANPSSFAASYKSDMRGVDGQLGPLLHRGDLVVVGQPEQTPLAWYYLPAGLRYANPTGTVTDPRYMNWTNALHRLSAAQPQATLGPLVASLKPGQQLLYVRPLTEGAQNWEAPWTQLVRRRSAQWGAILTSDVAAGLLKPVAVAPQNYRGACCVADSAMLYRKAS